MRNPAPGLAWIVITAVTLCGIVAPAFRIARGQDTENSEPEGPAKLSERIRVDSRQIPRRGPKLTSYADILEKAKKSVVRVFTAKMERPRRTPFADDLLFDRMFRGQEGPADEHSMTGLGSGIIISEDGYILTNNHLIAGADQIKVEVPGNRTRHNAVLIGADPHSDIAVIKLDGNSFPRATLADSAQSRVGDIVFAIGSPFNYPQTVSMGIISALGRTDVHIIEGRYGTAGYENFIQTDASINPGNSGGALVDALGRVVGVNTAIASNTGGSQGIGFAIPMNMALRIAESLVDSGEVQRGYLGVQMEDRSRGPGVVVKGVLTGSPAHIAGFAPSDVILTVDERRVESVARLRLDIAATPPGRQVDFEVERGGATIRVPAVLAKKTPTGFELIGQPTPPDVPPQETPRRGILAPGVEVEELTVAARQVLGIGEEHICLIIASVHPASEAARAGLARGDLIAEIDQKAVGTVAEARERVRKAGRLSSSGYFRAPATATSRFG